MKEWLDQIINLTERLHAIEEGPDGVRVCNGYTGSIHIYEGIARLAAALKIPVVYNPNWDEEVGRAYFIYNGHEVFELYKKEEI